MTGAERKVGVVTPVGRPEYEYLREAAASLATLRESVYVEWRIVADGPLVDMREIKNAIHRAGVTATI
jgi:hypothetical protein